MSYTGVMELIHALKVSDSWGHDLALFICGSGGV